MLGYNKIRELTGLNTVLSTIMEKIQSIRWIDISHNYIVSLDYAFEHFPKLTTLYIHCNFIYDIAEL